MGNSKCSTQKKLKEDAEAFRKIKQGKYEIKSPDGGGENILVNDEDASCSLMMVTPIRELDNLLSLGRMFFQTSSQEYFQVEPITNEAK